ncbi:uncharacterized protein LOC113171132 [Anabas testudineus]|uniref:uncharacterized protein LOC113171132 n=1 Tax=Anabas testudineus TaxID=64144 RepID=UPI000E45785A|nr:uncharacterized protein LOC113171132 [Anabas testudineus]XP_026229298.1 uncharacterized protein LOC113171132 [Anabas testudineus]XP_026229300.1 uncharacterized protein LOC113171132 [Anabas testudineus]
MKPETRGKGEMWNKWKASHICCLLFLTLLQITKPSSVSALSSSTTMTSTLNTAVVGYRTLPVDVTVAEGESVAFGCGVAAASPNFTFTFYGSQRTYNLTCPNGYVEAIPQSLYGRCDMKNGESLAVWILNRTSISDNGSRVVCQQPNNPKAHSAVLHVNAEETSAFNIVSNNYAILIGCTVGGFFATILVFGLLYILLQRSESFQKCFRGKETEDDLSTMVTDD